MRYSLRTQEAFCRQVGGKEGKRILPRPLRNQNTGDLLCERKGSGVYRAFNTARCIVDAQEKPISLMSPPPVMFSAPEPFRGPQGSDSF